jgi:O-antigen biosynthesis protein
VALDAVSPLVHATVICTLGMHRSGTSLVTRALNLLGVYLGPDSRVMTSGHDNPTGYWEYRPFVDINDELLARFGGTWDEPPVFPADWLHDPCLEDLKESARALVFEDFPATPLWGWKDPRACLTLPFWQEAIGPMHYVLCLRNPSAVLASLARRSAMSGEKAERLWLAHVEPTLSQTIGQPRIVVCYEDIIEDWPRELRRLAAFIGNPARGDDPLVHAAMGAFVERELCHHRMSMEDLARDPRISFTTKSLYLAMRGHAGFPDQSLSLLAVQALATWDRTVAVAAARDEEARRNEATQQALQQVHASAAWRTIAFARSLIGRLLPDGTRRRRVYTDVVARIARRGRGPLRRH